MAIAPIGALEAALSSLPMSVGTQSQAIAAAAPAGNRMVGAMQEKHDAAKAGAAGERGDLAARPGQQMAQASPSASPALGGQSSNLEKAEPIVERQLFEYLAEAEKAGGTAFKGPTEMFGAAFKSLEGPLQQVQKAFGQSTSSEKSSAAAGQSPTETTEAADTRTDGSATTNEELLDRYISVMWAAANLELVTSSITAATSSTSTLVKQQ